MVKVKLRKIDPRKIVVPKIRVTSRFDPETLEMLRASMAAEGLVAPIICCEIDERLVLVDGVHRLEEAIRLQMPTVDVVITEGDMVDVMTRNLFMDHIRGKHPPSEMVAVVEELAKTYGLGPDDIAKKTGMTREYVENLMLISRLTPMVRAAIDDGSLRLTAAIQLCRLKTPEAQEEFFAHPRDQLVVVGVDDLGPDAHAHGLRNGSIQTPARPVGCAPRALRERAGRSHGCHAGHRARHARGQCQRPEQRLPAGPERARDRQRLGPHHRLGARRPAGAGRDRLPAGCELHDGLSRRTGTGRRDLDRRSFLGGQAGQCGS